MKLSILASFVTATAAFAPALQVRDMSLSLLLLGVCHGMASSPVDAYVCHRIFEYWTH